MEGIIVSPRPLQEYIFHYMGLGADVNTLPFRFYRDEQIFFHFIGKGLSFLCFLCYNSIFNSYEKGKALKSVKQ